MMYRQITAYFNGGLVMKKNDPTLERMLSNGTLNFLYQVGLPTIDNLIAFEPTTDTTILKRWGNRYLNLGLCAGTPLCVKFDNDGRIILLTEKEIYVNKDIDSFFRSLYTCASVHQMIIENKLGPIGENRQDYAKYMSKALVDIDPDIQHLDYFWMGVVESLEFGLVY